MSSNLTGRSLERLILEAKRAAGRALKLKPPEEAEKAAQSWVEALKTLQDSKA